MDGDCVDFGVIEVGNTVDHTGVVKADGEGFVVLGRGEGVADDGF